MKPQTTLKDATVIKEKRINSTRWTIEEYTHPTGKTQIAVCNGLFVYYPLALADGTVVYDHPERVPKVVKRWVQSYTQEIREL